MKKQNINTSIPIQFEKIDTQNIDERFTKVKIWLCSVGSTLHNSYFDKNVLDKMKNTLKNIPILGYIQVQNDNTLDMKGHEEELVISEDGVKVRYLGRAFGIIPENSNAKFEYKDEVEWLTCEGLLWNKFSDVIDIFNRDEIKKHSMELLHSSVEGYFDDNDGLYHFTDCVVEGACILGNSRIPAVPNSIIEKFSLQTIKEQLQDMIKEFQDTSFINNKKGGDKDMGKKTDFELTAQQLIDEMQRVISKNTFVDRWGDKISSYYYLDHDDNRIYAYDRSERYNVGFNYSITGDKIEIDYDSKKRIKFVPQDMEDTETTFDFIPLEDVKKIEEKYNNVKTDYEKTKTDLDKVQKENDILSGNFENLNKDFIEKDGVLKGITEKFDSLTTSYDSLKKDYDSLLNDSEELKKIKYEQFKSEKLDLINDKRFVKLTEEIKNKFCEDVDKYESKDVLENDLFRELGKVFAKYNVPENDNDISTNFDISKDNYTGYEKLVAEHIHRKTKNKTSKMKEEE